MSSIASASATMMFDCSVLECVCGLLWFELLITFFECLRVSKLSN